MILELMHKALAVATIHGMIARYKNHLAGPQLAVRDTNAYSSYDRGMSGCPTASQDKDTTHTRRRSSADHTSAITLPHMVSPNIGTHY